MSSSVSQSLNLALSMVRHTISGIGWLLYIISSLVAMSFVGVICFIVFVLSFRWVEADPKREQKPKLWFLGGLGRK